MTRIEWLDFQLNSISIRLGHILEYNKVSKPYPYKYDVVELYTKEIARLKCKLNQ